VCSGVVLQDRACTTPYVACHQHLRLPHGAATIITAAERKTLRPENQGLRERSMQETHRELLERPFTTTRVSPSSDLARPRLQRGYTCGQASWRDARPSHPGPVHRITLLSFVRQALPGCTSFFAHDQLISPGNHVPGTVLLTPPVDAKCQRVSFWYDHHARTRPGLEPWTSSGRHGTASCVPEISRGLQQEPEPFFRSRSRARSAPARRIATHCFPPLPRGSLYSESGSPFVSPNPAGSLDGRAAARAASATAGAVTPLQVHA